MFNPISWIKSNKLATVLLAIVLALVYLQLQKQTGTLSTSGQSGGSAAPDMYDMSAQQSLGVKNISFRTNEVAPQTDTAARMVSTNSQLSLVVKDVTAGISAIKSYIQSLGGYMVRSEISRPEEGGTGMITLRIPAERLDEALAQIKGQAVKVVSENIDGTDVTDAFVDNEAQLVILERNKATFEKIMDSAIDIEDILQVQSQIFSLQSQIDSIKGRQKYLEQTAKLSLVTMYLSTDELALPYAPAQAWRPEVIFKHAVRSLMTTFQGLGTYLIWLGVYAIIWLPIVLIVLLVARKRRTPVKLPQT